MRRSRRRPPWRAQSLAFYLGLPGNSGYKSGISGLGVPETPDERPEIPDIVSGESGVKPGVSGGWFLIFFIISAKTCRLPNKSKKNGKNTKLVWLDWLRLYLQGKNVCSCEMSFLPIVEFKWCLDSFN